MIKYILVFFMVLALSVQEFTPEDIFQKCVEGTGKDKCDDSCKSDIKHKCKPIIKSIQCSALVLNYDFIM